MTHHDDRIRRNRGQVSPLWCEPVPVADNGTSRMPQQIANDLKRLFDLDAQGAVLNHRNVDDLQRITEQVFPPLLAWRQSAQVQMLPNEQYLSHCLMGNTVRLS